MKEISSSIKKELGEQIPKCSESAVRLVLGLAFFMNASGVCWPGVKKLLEVTQLSERSFYRARKELKALGLTWVRQERRTVYNWPVFNFENVTKSNNKYRVWKKERPSVDSWRVEDRIEAMTRELFPTDEEYKKFKVENRQNYSADKKSTVGLLEVGKERGCGDGKID